MSGKKAFALLEQGLALEKEPGWGRERAHM